MAEFRLTIPQRQAVTAPIGNLLVAAAAGSGKTAVLSQRVLRHLTEEPILPQPPAHRDLYRVGFGGDAHPYRTALGGETGRRSAK